MGGGSDIYAALIPDQATGTDPIASRSSCYLAQNVPNPFNPVTTIEFGVGTSARVSLRIYDVSGRLVRVLADADIPTGRHRELWNGCDENGRPVAAGVYFCEMRAGSFSAVRKLVVLK